MTPRPLPALPVMADRIAAVLDGRARRRLNVPGRRAAVLIALYEHDGQPRIILTKRTETLAHHKGQISLPGGRWEEEDGDLVTTALRETHEEVGIPPQAVRVLGSIDDVHTIATDFIITPVVGALRFPPTTEPNPIEIARVMEVPLAEVLAHDAGLADGLGPLELRYPLDGEDVWGATARILRGFCRVVRCALEDTAAEGATRGGPSRG